MADFFMTPAILDLALNITAWGKLRARPAELPGEPQIQRYGISFAKSDETFQDKIIKHRQTKRYMITIMILFHKIHIVTITLITIKYK